MVAPSPNPPACPVAVEPGTLDAVGAGEVLGTGPVRMVAPSLKSSEVTEGETGPVRMVAPSFRSVGWGSTAPLPAKRTVSALGGSAGGLGTIGPAGIGGNGGRFGSTSSDRPLCSGAASSRAFSPSWGPASAESDSRWLKQTSAKNQVRPSRSSLHGLRSPHPPKPLAPEAGGAITFGGQLPAKAESRCRTPFRST